MKSQQDYNTLLEAIVKQKEKTMQERRVKLDSYINESKDQDVSMAFAELLIRVSEAENLLKMYIILSVMLSICLLIFFFLIRSR